MFEHRSQPLAPRHVFVLRIGTYVALAVGILSLSLVMGVVGYHVLEGLSWIDSLVNASMILGGMGPVGQLHTDGAKIFASFYALYSGVVFLISAGVLLAPALHRFAHRFHLEEAAGKSPTRKGAK